MPENLHYPEDEARLPWLGQLLESYRRTDRTVSDELASSKRKIACGKGCDSCCKNINVPINQVEMAGISWYVVEALAGQQRDRVIRTLGQHEPESGRCPFLVDTECGIYAVRPLACRTFYLHGEPCGPDENIFLTRENDFHRFPKRKMQKAALPMLAALGIEGKTRQMRSFDSDYLMNVSRSMLSIDWKTFILNNIALHDAITAAC